MCAFDITRQRSMPFEAGKATDTVRTQNRSLGACYMPPLHLPPCFHPFPPFLGKEAESTLLTGNDRG